MPQSKFTHPTVLAVSSPGNCWVELKKHAEVFSDAKVLFAVSTLHNTNALTDEGATQITGFTLYSFWKIPLSAFQIFKLAIHIRPKWIISTGGGAGVLALICGRIIGARTIWIESLYNSQEISLSGKIAGLFAHTWLTQWQHQATKYGPEFKGALL